MRRFCVGLVVSLSAGIFGCTPEWGLTSMCDHPNDFHLVDGKHVPCNGAEDWCRCAYNPPQDWGEPAFLWLGPDADAPTCESLGLTWDYEGHIVLTPAPECPSCNCAPPVGSCRLPLEFTAYAAPGCPGSGATQTSFNATDPWDGSCTMDNAIQVDKPCGNEPCVQSLSVEPMGVVEQIQCTKIDPPPALFTAGPWEAFGRICRTTEAGKCHDHDSVCLPPIDGVRTCVHRRGEFDEYGWPWECPPHYTEKMIFYERYADNRSCSECSCGPPVGSTCTSQISIYSNSTCSGAPLHEWTHDDKMIPDNCFDLSPGVALGSKKASLPIYTPGACEPSGGEPIGSVVREVPRTVCCTP